MKRPQVVVAGSPEAFVEAAASRIVEEARAAVYVRGRCAIALAGGSTPRPVYEHLTQPEFAGEIAWDKLDVYFSDERCAPPDHGDSNYRMVCESLINNSPLRPEQVHRIEAERPDADQAAAEYGEMLPERLDVLVLGMGEEGHTASLYPGSPALDEQQRRAVAVETPAQPSRRITITPPVIAAAHSVLVLIAGEAKAAMVARALRGPHNPKEIPIQLARNGVWILDRAAAEHVYESSGAESK